MCVACPKPEECSLQAFKGADCWSYISEDQVRNYVCRHLEVSSKHYMSKEDASYWALMAEIHEETETYQERMAYLRSLEAAQKSRLQASSKAIGARPASDRRPVSPPGSAGARPPQRSRSPRREGSLSSEIRDLTAAMTDVVKMQLHLAKAGAPAGPSSASSSAPELSLRPSEPMVQVPVSSLRLLASSLGQIRDCVERLTVLTPVIVNAQAAMEQLAAQGR